MTPIEKAKELVDEFKSIDIDYNDSIEGACFMCMSNSDAKQCALIAVNKIIDKNGYNNDYWQQVKQEIENL